MTAFVQPAIGILFIIAALILCLVAARDGRTEQGRWSIAARTRFKIAFIFMAVGIGLVIFFVVM